MGRLHKIDSLPAVTYHDKLAPYTKRIAQEFPSLKELEWRIQCSTGYTISPAFDLGLNLTIPSEKNYLKLLLDKNISEHLNISKVCISNTRLYN
uniref:Uncharacterized protein n=1 Tax=Romanomermis culicivorax TaxID=13658 RepID=A0A915I027_ROMCU